MIIKNIYNKNYILFYFINNNYIILIIVNEYNFENFN
jgi:hypothetical protein